MQTTVKNVFERLRGRVSGLHALALVSGEGELLAFASADYKLNTESFAEEYATLLRIARRTAEDTGIGDISEHILISKSAVIVARLLPSDRFAIFLCTQQEQLGRLRYELRSAARDLEEGIQS